MFLLQSVEGGKGRISLSKKLTVLLLVCGAIVANIQAFHRVQEIKREAIFRQELSRNLQQLIDAADQVHRTTAR